MPRRKRDIPATPRVEYRALPKEEVVKLWETVSESDERWPHIVDALDWWIADSTEFTSEDFYEMNNKGGNYTIYFLPRSDAYRLYGKSVTLKVNLGWEDIEWVSSGEGCSTGRFTASEVFTPEFTREQFQCIKEVGFYSSAIYRIDFHEAPRATAEQVSIIGSWRSFVFSFKGQKIDVDDRNHSTFRFWPNNTAEYSMTVNGQTSQPARTYRWAKDGHYGNIITMLGKDWGAVKLLPDGNCKIELLNGHEYLCYKI